MIAAKALALNRKLRIYIIFGKEDNLLRYTQIFEFFFPGSFRSIWFSTRNFRSFRLNGSLFGNWTTAAKTSDDKGFNDSYNSSARVINLCTFRSQPMQNKQMHPFDVFIVPTDKWQDSKLKYWSIFEYSSPSSLRKMFTSPWSWPKELALNKKNVNSHFRKFPEFSVEWFAFRKFNNFRIFWIFSLGIYVPFVPVSKISEILVEW